MEASQVVAGRLRRARQEHGLTLQQLSARTNLSVSYLSQLEHGTRLNPSRQALLVLAEALGLPPAALVDAAEPQEAAPAPAPLPISDQFLAYWHAMSAQARERLALAPTEERFTLVADFLLARQPDRFPNATALARHLGMSPEQLEAIRSRGSEVSATFLGRMAEVTGLPLSFLAFGSFTGSPGPTPPAGEAARYLAVIRLALERQVSPERLEELIRSLG